MGNTKDATGAVSATPTPTQTVADLQAGYDRIETIGGLLKITSQARQNLTASQTKVGWLIIEIDTGRIYERTSDAPQGKLVYGKIRGAFGSDGNAVVDSQVIELGADGYVDLRATTRRQGDTSYKTHLILGVVPAGFRPAEDTFAEVITTDVESAGNWARISAADGIVKLISPAPDANHKAARLKARYPV